MPTLNITEYERPDSGDLEHGIRLGVEEGRNIHQQLQFNSTSVCSAAFNAETSMIKIISDADCRIEINADPTATVDTQFILAGSPQDRFVPKGESFRIAVIEHISNLPLDAGDSAGDSAARTLEAIKEQNEEIINLLTSIADC